MTLRRGIAVPCFADDPQDLVQLGVATEQAGFEGFFVWDHLIFTDDLSGPPIVDPWVVMTAVAVQTQTLRLGPMVTPVSRRRPWQLARETTTLDRLSGGRLVFGAGLGSPAYGDFERFGDVGGGRERAELLDEGLDVLAGLWSGEEFAYSGAHYTVEPVRFEPTPTQRPRIPVWIGGSITAAGPISRAARWDGMVPIRWVEAGIGRPSIAQIGTLRESLVRQRGSLDDFDLAVWDRLGDQAPDEAMLAEYESAGVTWWVETASGYPGWWPQARRRIELGR